jgi:peptide/nickel transport system ATP-binding protein
MTRAILTTPPPAVLEVRGLRTEFPQESGAVVAVDDVSLSVLPREVLGIVGESGSGKSVTAYSILGLVDAPGRITAGSIRFGGRELVGSNEAALRAIRGNRIAMIFQDPMTSLHPLLRIEKQMVDAILAHRNVACAAARDEACAALTKVGIPSAAERLRAYPHQLSGGMRQRVAIAIAMLNKPDLIIADEPTTALDVTTQAQIIYEMKALCADVGTALIWISHDLAVISEIADRVAVMYGGSVVETGPVDQILSRPAHPYTAGLIASIPAHNRGARRLAQIRGSVQPAPTAAGCRFAPRCDHASDACRVMPDLREAADGRALRCYHPVYTRGDYALGDVR